ncbi:Protein sel-1 -like protein 3 [Collichthys lucidus]|uniref:Protein sel-1-like protein 3 n=1 Tax=Collichthys lucidus TaxID=240159 RepID=A0A4U5V0Y7_COLLU|nr:Protein sel-1 -like protein 3 [Collichthys lucidus]
MRSNTEQGIVWGLDQVTLLNPPEEPLSDHFLEILYSCDEPATVQLDCIVSFDTGITSTLPLRQWSCVPGDPKIRTLALNLPDWLVYQADGIVPDSQWVLSCILLASVRHSGFDDSKKPVAAQDVATLQPKLFFDRPVKQHQLCIAWSTQMLQLTQPFSKKQCPLERETVHLLSSLYASTGEIFGITKTLDPHSSEVLEYLRVKAISFPWMRHAVVLDDTEGYFVIGGGRYIRGVEGFFGPLVYYRNRVSPHSMSEAVIPDVIRTVNLTGWLQTCHKFHVEMTLKIMGYSLQAQEQTESETCLDAFHEWMVKDRLPPQSQCGLWEATVPQRRQAANLVKLLAFKHGERGLSLPAVGRALYSLSLHKLDGASSTGVVSRILPLLLQAGCLADNRALHMSSVLYSAGLGVKKQPNKAWLLALLAAQKDDRLALLQLGHLHYQGLHGLPTDTDLAYAYYANVAKQTTLDRLNHTPDQTYVEAVYLNNDEMLNLQTSEDHHIFQWLKLQAGRGAAEAEQAIGRMLFWGQQGVSPNIQKAVRHYERGAVRLEDPVSMYDYGIVLMTGQGVERDIPKAVTFLKKAMDHGFVPAINALAWYHEQFEHDYKQAVQLWEQADFLESPDAALNLGVVYSQGLYPGKPADQFGFLDPDFASDCMWRYYNLTIQSKNPDPYALIRMGDLLYEEHDDRQKDLFSAAEMYTRAALRNEPQGWYNLGLLVEEGFRLPLSVLIDLGLSELYLADNSVLLSTLYKRWAAWPEEGKRAVPVVSVQRRQSGGNSLREQWELDSFVGYTAEAQHGGADKVQYPMVPWSHRGRAVRDAERSE